MRYRPVDSNGDMIPIPKSSYMLQGSQAVAAAIHSRLRLLYGEWWQDEQAGFRLPAFLFQDTRLVKNKELLAAYVTSYIQKTQGVFSTNGHAYMSDRTLVYDCDVVTEYSQRTSKIEVSQDVIRSAIS